MALIGSYIASFTTVFLGIFIEAVPFLLLGTMTSGLVEVFISREQMIGIIPRNPILATFVGGLMGFVFPVCECGVVPLTRRLFNKGLPISSGIAFLLAAPIINPVVLASTFAAYGWGPILWARFGFGFLIASAVGLVFSLGASEASMLRTPNIPAFGDISSEMIPLSAAGSLGEKGQKALRIAGDEFFEMGRYLVLGSLLAALLQTIVPSSALLPLASGPLLSVLVMQVLAFVLSVCSTVDAFLSLAFVRVFTTGSILSFLVFGPMVDIKSTWMLLGVFQRRIVVYLILLTLLMTLLMGVFINLNTTW